MNSQEMKQVTDQCFESHKNEIEKTNKSILKKVKTMIMLQVTLPVTILLALGFWMLQTTFSIGKESAKHQATTNEKVDVMGRAIMDETKARRDNDEKIKTKIEHLETKLDENLMYLYKNSQFITRGGDLPFMIK